MKRKITAIIISLLMSMMLFVTACQEEQKSQSSIVKTHAAVTAVPRTDKGTNDGGNSVKSRSMNG